MTEKGLLFGKIYLKKGWFNNVFQLFLNVTQLFFNSYIKHNGKFKLFKTQLTDVAKKDLGFRGKIYPRGDK